MLGVLLPIFMVDTKIIYVHNFVAPFIHFILEIFRNHPKMFTFLNLLGGSYEEKYKQLKQ